MVAAPAGHGLGQQNQLILKVFSHTMRLLVDFFRPYKMSVLAWPAWRRVLAMLPVCALLWLAVFWALSKEFG
jgi:hypothetical protein